jgi:hypothetical protein
MIDISLKGFLHVIKVYLSEELVSALYVNIDLSDASWQLSSLVLYRAHRVLCLCAPADRSRFHV